MDFWCDEQHGVPFHEHPVVLKLCDALRGIGEPVVAQEIESWDWSRPTLLKNAYPMDEEEDAAFDIFDRLFTWYDEKEIPNCGRIYEALKEYDDQ
jgi:hypothetical protein